MLYTTPKTPLPGKLIPISKGSAQVNDQGVSVDDVPFAPESVSLEKGKWLSISGLALTNGEQNYLFVTQSCALLGSWRKLENSPPPII